MDQLRSVEVSIGFQESSELLADDVLGRRSCDDKLSGCISLPVMVRLEALATWTRMAGRATLTVEEAMDEARREASTRVEAIVTDGRESCEKRTILDRREGLGELLKTARRTVGLVWMREKMKTEGKRTERRSGERVGHGPTQGKLAASLPASNDLPKFRLRLGYHGPIGSQSGNTRTHYIMAVVGPSTQPKASKEGKMTPREPERHYLCSGDIGSSYTNETLKRA